MGQGTLEFEVEETTILAPMELQPMMLQCYHL